MPLRAEEALEDVLDLVQMSLLDIPTDIKSITEYGLTGATHNTELSAQIRQVLRLRGLSRSLRSARRRPRHRFWFGREGAYETSVQSLHCL